jgi:hypothetical protein
MDGRVDGATRPAVPVTAIERLGFGAFSALEKRRGEASLYDEWASPSQFRCTASFPHPVSPHTHPSLRVLHQINKLNTSQRQSVLLIHRIRRSTHIT